MKIKENEPNFFLFLQFKEAEKWIQYRYFRFWLQHLQMPHMHCSSFNDLQQLGTSEQDCESIKKNCRLPLDEAFVQLTGHKDEVLKNCFKTLFPGKSRWNHVKKHQAFEDTASHIQRLKYNEIYTGIGELQKIIIE